MGRRFLSALAASLMLTGLLASAQEADRIVAPVNSAELVALDGNLPRWASPEFDLGPVSADVPLQYLRMTLARSPEREAAFQQLLLDQQDRNSPRYHAWMTAQQIGEQFGPSSHDIAAVSAWLESQGFAVDFVANSRMFVIFHGTVAQADHAFHTAMHWYASSVSARMSASETPQIPIALAAVIRSVQGLSQTRHQPAVHARPEYTPCYESVCYHYITPADFATIYDINSVYASSINGAGQTISIVGRAQVWSPDITEYEANTGLPSETPALIVPPSGAEPPAPNDSSTQTPNDDQTEATLDVERSFGTAPGAAVDLVVSLSTQTEDGIDIAKDYVIDNASTLHTSILSNSFGECEADVSASTVQADNTLFQQAAAEGISLLGISGDSGAAGCDPYNATPPVTQTKSPNYLCSSSYVTCLGGTEFNDTTDPSEYWSTTNSSTLESAISYIPEGAWNEPYNSASKEYYASSTGGGVSSVIATPYWQQGTGVPGTAGRYTPDIAFSSSAHDGYYGCYAAGDGACSLNEYEYFFGTSAAAPSMAGVVALLNQKLGSAQGTLNPTLYSLANSSSASSVFHDATITTSGITNCTSATPSMCNNSTPAQASLTGGLAGFDLTTGFDLATGWGSLDVANLLSHWLSGGPDSTTATLTVSPSDSFAAGTPATLTAKISGTGTISTGTVSFYSGTTYIGTSAVSGGSASFTASTIGLAPGSYPVVAKFSGSATEMPSSSAAVTVTLKPANSVTTLAASSTSVTPPASVTLTATVTSPDGTPTGSVTFYYLTDDLGSANLSGGKATFTASTSGVAAGNYALHAVYAGSSAIAGSTSTNSVTVTVK
jgi:subtilase family serine protease